MAENSTIEWTDHTFNPWIGCQKVGPGCDHCYAEAWDARGLQGQAKRWGAHATRTRTSPANWRKPLSWDKAAAAAGERHRVFCASLADVFDNHASIQMNWRLELSLLICSTTNLDWLLLTKRIGNAERFLRDMFPAGVPPNVAIGITVVNQAEADRDIPKLLDLKARLGIRWVFLSVEPMLGPVDLLVTDHHGHDIDALRGIACDPTAPDEADECYRTAKLDWVIVGGESGPGARPIHPDWVRSLRNQCVRAGVPFFFKQWGEWAPLDFGGDVRPGQEIRPDIGMIRVGKKAAGRLLSGSTWDQMPGVAHA